MTTTTNAAPDTTATPTATELELVAAIPEHTHSATERDTARRMINAHGRDAAPWSKFTKDEVVNFCDALGVPAKGTKQAMWERALPVAAAIREKTNEESLPVFLARRRWNFARKNRERLAELREGVAKGVGKLSEATEGRALCYALSWSGDLFALAAELQVREELHESFVHGSEFSEVESFIQKQVARLARNLNNRSSGALHNVVADHTVAAWGCVADELTW